MMKRRSPKTNQALDVLLMAAIVILAVCATATTMAWSEDRTKTRLQIAAIHALVEKCSGFRPVADAVLSDTRTINPYGYRYASDIADQMATMSPKTSACREALPIIG